jgi:hypothetical protein
MATKLTGRLTCSVFTLALACLLGQPAAFAQDAAAKAADKPDQPLALSKVVMFNAGVSYFEHRGQVDGNAKVELRFRVDDINDLLKSMILEDRGGGTISTVSYGSRDPITKTLQTFPINLTDNPTLGQILNQVRGERVQVDAPTPTTGVLLGIEIRKRDAGKDHNPIDVEYLNLLTDEGLRSVPMESISRIKLLDEKLDGELRQALQVLATGHNTDKKTVTLNLLGQGKRPVRVGYVQGTPVWKTSYRLVLDDKQSPFLQGWAIVENTTEGDWNNVSLTLVSGRPISYTMDLYEPLYVQRPVETWNLFSSLRPQRYGQDMDEADKRFAIAKPGLGGGRDQSRKSPLAERRGEEGRVLRGAGQIAAAAAPAAGEPVKDSFSTFETLAINGSAGASAQAGDVGELFQYVIATPVTLERQKSAMLPIVNESVKGEKVSIYNEAVQAKHPLNGLRLVNSTDLHLMQGPVTVFDGGAYAGDAMIEDLAPKSERLISYALDLKTEVAPVSKSQPEHLVSIKLVKGTMLVSRKHTRTHEYTVKNSDTKAKNVLIEYPLDANWKLLAPEKPTEKTRDKYRFLVKAEPGKPATLKIEEEQVVSQTLVLSNIDDNTIVFYLNQKDISPAAKAALQEIVKRKQALQQLAQDHQRLDQQIVAIGQEQDRIRQNMGQLDRTTELYKRYVEKFGDQETKVEKMREQIQKLTTEEAQLRRALDDYLINLNI